MEKLLEASREILRKMTLGEIKDSGDLSRAKIEACRKFGLPRPPRNSEILSAAGEDERRGLIDLLRIKPVRSLSGVSVITVMPRPYPCPKDSPCIYCPGGPASGTPQSYTGREPAAMRALQHNFDPYAQVKSRIDQLRAIGHEVDKVELIIFGGTLTAYPPDYLEWFVTQCLNAMSGASAATIEEAQAAAETAPVRVSDIALETRPDWCRKQHVDLMLRLGATRVELGVQTVHEDIYRLVGRGHTVEDVAEATRMARDAGFAVVYHCMLNLPGSSYERDLESFREIFSDERFKPDAIKIYPTLVLPGTGLHELWMKGEYSPYPLEQLVGLISEIKRMVPRWVRIQRIQRDIPLTLVSAGGWRGDLRALVQRRMAEEGTRCRCIRCREVGHARRRLGEEPGEVKLLVERYRASGGEEVFISAEDVERDILVGLLRLRQPSESAHRPEVAGAMIVRELHVYGPLVPVEAEAGAGEWQHRGVGRALLQEAERISREEFDARKIAVLAGIGTRNYYRRFGYGREGPYMVKELKASSRSVQVV